MLSPGGDWREPLDQLREGIALLKQRLPLMSEPDRAVLSSKIAEFETMAANYETDMEEALSHRQDLLDTIAKLKEGGNDAS